MAGVSEFASAWDSLTSNQRNALLAQLREFLSQNSRRNGGPPRSGGSHSTKTQKKFSLPKRAKQKKLTSGDVSTRKSGYASVGDSDLEPTGGVLHHSPAKIGIDGYPKYGRALISRRALETLDRNWKPPASAQSKNVGMRVVKDRSNRSKIVR